MKKFEEFVNERFEYESSTINGKKVFSKFQGSTPNMNEFIKALKNIPKTIESIEIPVDTGAFNPSREKIKGPFSSAKINKLIKIVKEMTKQFKEKGDPITEYQIRSYYGVLSGDREVNDPLYIQFRTDKHDNFNKAMSRGDFGPLD